MIHDLSLFNQAVPALEFKEISVSHEKIYKKTHKRKYSLHTDYFYTMRDNLTWHNVSSCNVDSLWTNIFVCLTADSSVQPAVKVLCHVTF